MKRLIIATVVILAITIPAYGSQVTASYYSNSLAGHRTASGQKYNPNKLTAAHKTLPFGTKLRVSRCGKSVIVVVNDRGPFVRGRTLDLSRAAAARICLIGAGVGSVKMEVL